MADSKQEPDEPEISNPTEEPEGDDKGTGSDSEGSSAKNYGEAYVKSLRKEAEVSRVKMQKAQEELESLRKAEEKKKTEKKAEEGKFKELYEESLKKAAELETELTTVKGRASAWDKYQEKRKSDLLEAFPEAQRKVYSKLELEDLEALALEHKDSPTRKQTPRPDKAGAGAGKGAVSKSGVKLTLSQIHDLKESDPEAYKSHMEDYRKRTRRTD